MLSVYRLWGMTQMTNAVDLQQEFLFPIAFTNICFSMTGIHNALGLHKQFGATFGKTNFSIGLDETFGSTYTIRWIAVGV